jgi:hypothetical protein
MCSLPLVSCYSLKFLTCQEMLDCHDWLIHMSGRLRCTEYSIGAAWACAEVVICGHRVWSPPSDNTAGTCPVPAARPSAASALHGRSPWPCTPSGQELHYRKNIIIYDKIYSIINLIVPWRLVLFYKFGQI